MLIKKFISYLRYEKNCSSHTEISYFRDLSQFREFVELERGKFVPYEVDPTLLRKWLVALIEQGLKASTVNRKLSAIKSFFTYLQKKQYVKNNPALYVGGPKINRTLPSFVKHADMVKVLNPDAFSDDFEGRRNLFMIELLYLTGVRLEELIGIKDKDVDFYTNLLRVNGKRNKERFIPFSNKTKELFVKYIEIRDQEVEERSPFLLVRKNGKKLYPELVYSIVNKHLSNIKTLAVKSPHVLRHSFATVMLNNGSEISAVKDLLGHASLASTQIYTHVSFKELVKVYNNAHPRA